MNLNLSEGTNINAFTTMYLRKKKKKLTKSRTFICKMEADKTSKLIKILHNKQNQTQFIPKYNNTHIIKTEKRKKGKRRSDLGVRQNVVIIMAQATRAANKLPKDNVTERVFPPTIWVSSSHLLRLFPALLLHAVRETPRICGWIRRWYSKVRKESWNFFFRRQFIVEKSRWANCCFASSSRRRRRRSPRCCWFSSFWLSVWSHFWR